MQVQSVKTHKVTCGESLEELLDKYLPDLQERSVIGITSKIISVIEGRYVEKNKTDKYQLIKQESDLLLKTSRNPYDLYLTIKDGLLIPSAGIDESNVNDVYVLYPSDVWTTAERTWQYLRRRHSINELGVVITDSQTTIMRRGVTGVALGWCGFEPLYSYIGQSDLYGQPLKMTQINIVDALATAAVFVMGEGDEQTPLAVIMDAPHLTFLDRPTSKEGRAKVAIDPEEDLYGPLLKAVQWE